MGIIVRLHIINAEGEKIQFALGTLGGITSPPATLSDILLVNESVRDTIRELTKKEWLLQSKLESILSTPTTNSSMCFNKLVDLGNILSRYMLDEM